MLSELYLAFAPPVTHENQLSARIQSVWGCPSNANLPWPHTAGTTKPTHLNHDESSISSQVAEPILRQQFSIGLVALQRLSRTNPAVRLLLLSCCSVVEAREKNDDRTSNFSSDPSRRCCCLSAMTKHIAEDVRWYQGTLEHTTKRGHYYSLTRL